MFDLKEFIKENLVAGVKNGTFAKEYANILAVNYLSKGIIGTEDVELIASGIDAVLAEPETQNPVETPSEEIPSEEQTV